VQSFSDLFVIRSDENGRLFDGYRDAVEQWRLRRHNVARGWLDRVSTVDACGILTQMARTCIFCDSPLAGNRAEEHAIPRWLMEFLGLTDGKLYLAVAHSQDNAILKDRTQVVGNFVEGRVCEGCNNGWMNDLEKQTKELLKPLIQGTTNLLSLSDDERATLARWATKTGFVISHASPLKKTPLPSDMRYMKDHAGDVPPRVEVFGQQFLSTLDFNQIQRNQWPHIAAGPPREDPAPPDLCPQSSIFMNSCA